MDRSSIIKSRPYEGPYFFMIWTILFKLMLGSIFIAIFMGVYGEEKTTLEEAEEREKDRRRVSWTTWMLDHYFRTQKFAKKGVRDFKHAAQKTIGYADKIADVTGLDKVANAGASVVGKVAATAKDVGESGIKAGKFIAETGAGAVKKGIQGASDAASTVGSTVGSAVKQVGQVGKAGLIRAGSSAGSAMKKVSVILQSDTDMEVKTEIDHGSDSDDAFIEDTASRALASGVGDP